jgi:hypothetical protein
VSDSHITRDSTCSWRIIRAVLFIACLNLGSTASPLDAQPLVSLERPYQGEASYDAMKKVWPRMSGQWTTLSPLHARTKFLLSWNGALRTYIYPWPDDSGHKDLKIYKDDTLLVSFGAGDPPFIEEVDIDQVDQRLIRGYLPGTESSWHHEGFQYSQVAFAALLDADRVTTGKEATVAVIRMTVKNVGHAQSPAHLWVNLDTAEPLHWENNFIYDQKDRVRAYIRPQRSVTVTFVDREQSPTKKDGLKFSADLALQRQFHIDVIIPAVPTSKEKEAVISKLDFDASYAKFISEWQLLVDQGMKIDVPEQVINDFYRSQIGQLLCSSQLDPYKNRLFLKDFPFGRYVMAMLSMAFVALDQNGHHEMVGRYIENCHLASQGTLQPEGKFTSKEGFLSGPAAWEGDEWPVKNGFVLWGIVEHYKLSRDRKWLERALPHMLASCDWIKRERATTKKLDENGKKPVAYGALPPHRISDWQVDQYGLWTDSWNYRGLAGTAEILQELGHPRAEEMMREAADYRQCLRDAVERSIARADKMTLPNGDTIPYFPHELNSVRPRVPGGKYGDEFDGWGEWVEYVDVGPLWLVEAGIFGANEQEITWLLRFLEEYPVRLVKSGYPKYSPLMVHSIPFGCEGCYSPQAETYYWRDEIDKLVEGFYSALAGAYSWKTFIGRDHRPPYGSFYPITVQHRCRYLRLMLLKEDGNDLWIARGIPRAWLGDGKTVSVKDAATYFGKMSYEIRSRVAKNVIEATIHPPRRNPPADMKIKLRLRHPEDVPIKSVTIDGEPWHESTADTVTIPTGNKKQIEVVAEF